MATIQERRYEITLETRLIPKPYAAVMARLESSILQSPHPAFAILNHVSSRQDFEDATNAQLGPHGFMQFMQLGYGRWTDLYDVHKGRQATRIVFGNPQIAVTMLRHDIRAGLFVPVEALMVEREDGKGTDVVQVRPSSIIAGAEGASDGLREAARVLDGKIEALWEFVAGEE